MFSIRVGTPYIVCIVGMIIRNGNESDKNAKICTCTLILEIIWSLQTLTVVDSKSTELNRRLQMSTVIGFGQSQNLQIFAIRRADPFVRLHLRIDHQRPVLRKVELKCLSSNQEYYYACGSGMLLNPKTGVRSRLNSLYHLAELLIMMALSIESASFGSLSITH